MPFDLSAAIMDARLGAARREAQETDCGPFAAALYDVLKANGLSASLYVIACRCGGRRDPDWYHAVVRFGGRYYDSMGEISLEIYRRRARVHPKVTLDFEYKRDRREFFIEDDEEALCAFYIKRLTPVITAALSKSRPGVAA